MRQLLVIGAICSMVLLSCWPTSVSFNDTGSLNPCLKYFQMDVLENFAANAPINYSVDLTEAIKNGVQNNTRLLLAGNNVKPQVTITGKIASYAVTPIAIQQGDNAGQNRLTISANFEIFFDCPTEKYSHEMKMASSRFADFNPNTQDLASIESQLLEEINAQIVQDVINQILSNW